MTTCNVTYSDGSADPRTVPYASMRQAVSFARAVVKGGFRNAAWAAVDGDGALVSYTNRHGRVIRSAE